MRGICKRFPGVQALQDAGLEVLPGEVHVLLGENGAGKSTLVKILCGQYAADSGGMTFAGQSIRPASPLEAERLGLVMIHQEFNLVPGLTVAENVFLGHEPTRAGLIRSEAMREGAQRLLSRRGGARGSRARPAVRRGPQDLPRLHQLRTAHRGRPPDPRDAPVAGVSRARGRSRTG